MPKPEKVILQVTLERPVNEKGQAVGYGELITFVKEAIEAHGSSNSITAPLAKCAGKAHHT
jgi:hypothetical protein